MTPPRKSPQLRLVAGERKSGETRRRANRQQTRNPKVDVPDPGPLPALVKAVFDRIAPALHRRSLLTDENIDLLVRYAEAVVLAEGARAAMFDDEGAPVPLVSGDKGRTVKNPAAQVWRDATATMRGLAATLHLDELGLGDNPDPDPGVSKERLLT